MKSIDCFLYYDPNNFSTAREECSMKNFELGKCYELRNEKNEEWYLYSMICTKDKNNIINSSIFIESSDDVYPFDKRPLKNTNLKLYEIKLYTNNRPNKLVYYFNPINDIKLNDDTKIEFIREIDILTEWFSDNKRFKYLKSLSDLRKDYGCVIRSTLLNSGYSEGFIMMMIKNIRRNFKDNNIYNEIAFKGFDWLYYKYCRILDNFCEFALSLKEECCSPDVSAFLLYDYVNTRCRENVEKMYEI